MKRPGGFDTGATGDQPRVTPAAPRDPGPGAQQGQRGSGGQSSADHPSTDPSTAARPGVLDRLSRRPAAGGSARSGEQTQDATGASGDAAGASGAAEDFSETHDLSATQDFSATQDLSATVDLSGASEAARSTGGLVERARRGGAVLQRRMTKDPDPVRAAEKRLRAAERQNKKRLKRETRRFTAASRRRRRRVFIVLGTVAGLVLFVLVGALTPVMSVRDVRVEGATSVNVEEVQQALSEFEGVPLALVDENAVLRALEGFPLIQRFAVERVPPKTLVVRIEERVPTIAIEQEGVFRMFDAAGVLVGEAAERPEGVPLGSGGLSNTSSKGFLAASKIVRDMPAGLRAQLVSVEASSGQDVTFQLANGIEVFWGNPEETKRKSLVLETMLASLQERPVSHIDVSSTESPIFK